MFGGCMELSDEKSLEIALGEARGILATAAQILNEGCASHATQIGIKNTIDAYFSIHDSSKIVNIGVEPIYEYTRG